MGFTLPWEHGYVPTSPAMDGTRLAYDTTYLEQGRGRLLAQFQGRPRLEAVQGILLAQLQHVEMAFWQLWSERRLNAATFDTLRVIAHRLGVRGYDTMDDAILRRLLLAWVRVLRSSGRGEDLIAVARLFTASSAFRLERFFPGAVVVALDMELGDAEGWLLGRLLRRAGSAGVVVITEFEVEHDVAGVRHWDDPFRFSLDLDDDEASDTEGFSFADAADEADPNDIELGGRLVAATTGDE